MIFISETPPLKIALLGATGYTGSVVLQQALAAGHHVIAPVRNPDKLTTQHENLKVTFYIWSYIR